MSSTAEQIKNIILKHQDGASKQQIVRELNLSLDYLDLICGELERKGELVFRDGFYSLATPDHKPPKRWPRVLRRKPDTTIQNRAKLATTGQTSCRRGKYRKSSNKVRKVYSKSALLGIPKIKKELIPVLEKAGYKTIESLADAPITRFMQETKLELHEAAGLVNQAKKLLNKIGE